MDRDCKIAFILTPERIFWLREPLVDGLWTIGFIKSSKSLFMCTLLFAGISLFKTLENRDCNVNNDIHSQKSDGTPDHNKCQERCIIYENCVGFAVARNTCYFKDLSCRNNLKHSTSTTLFLMKGSEVSRLFSQ